MVQNKCTKYFYNHKIFSLFNTFWFELILSSLLLLDTIKFCSSNSRKVKMQTNFFYIGANNDLILIGIYRKRYTGL